MSYSNLVNRIHTASSGDLAGLRTEIINSGLYGTGMGEDASFAYNHVWREFNRRAISDTYNFDELIAGPVDAGFRPQNGVLETGNFGGEVPAEEWNWVTVGGDNFVTVGGDEIHISMTPIYNLFPEEV